MGNAPALPEPHEVIYEQALRRIAALDETWQEAVRDVVPQLPAADVPALPAPVVQAVRSVVPPVPRAPLTVPAEISALPGPETAEALLARAEAPRWRRSLVG